MEELLHSFLDNFRTVTGDTLHSNTPYSSPDYPIQLGFWCSHAVAPVLLYDAVLSVQDFPGRPFNG